MKIDIEKIKLEIRRICTPRRMAIFGAVFLGMFLLVILMDNLVMPWYTKHGEALAVPSIVGKRYEEAKEMLELNDLIAVKSGEKNDPNLPFGYVLEQNPLANRLVKKGRRVYLTISVGERDLEVPNLVGLSENNAGERLKSVGLRVGEIDYVYAANEVKDIVLEQDPRPREMVKGSAVINLTVSLGEPTENVAVPNVLAKTLEVAQREIQRAGLHLGRISYKLSDEFLPNTVIDQSIPAGTIVDHGDTLNVTVTTVTGDGQ